MREHQKSSSDTNQTLTTFAQAYANRRFRSAYAHGVRQEWSFRATDLQNQVRLVRVYELQRHDAHSFVAADRTMGSEGDGDFIMYEADTFAEVQTFCDNAGWATTRENMRQDRV